MFIIKVITTLVKIIVTSCSNAHSCNVKHIYSTKTEISEKVVNQWLGDSTHLSPAVQASGIYQPWYTLGIGKEHSYILETVCYHLCLQRFYLDYQCITLKIGSVIHHMDRNDLRVPNAFWVNILQRLLGSTVGSYKFTLSCDILAIAQWTPTLVKKW